MKFFMNLYGKMMEFDVLFPKKNDSEKILSKNDIKANNKLI